MGQLVSPFMSFPAAGFAPTDITGLGAWFDPSDAATITKDGSNQVSQLADKSGNANHATQATDADKPLDQGDLLNGKRVLQYDRSLRNSVQLNLPLNLIRNLPGFTVTAVVRRSTTSARWAFGFATNGGTASAWFRGEQQAAWYAAGRRVDADTFAEISGGDTTTANWHIVTWRVDWQNTTLQVFANGALAAESTTFQTSGNSEDLDAGAAILGGNHTLTGSWRDQMAEVTMYQKPIDTTERQDLEGYMSTGWNVALA